MADDEVDDISVVRLQIIYDDLNVNNVFIERALIPLSTAFMITALVKKGSITTPPEYVSTHRKSKRNESRGSRRASRF